MMLSYFFWRENGDVIFVDEPGFFFNHFGRVVLFEILTGEPKEDVLLTVFALKELTEDGPTHGASHQTVERVAPAPDLLYARPTFFFYYQKCSDDKWASPFIIALGNTYVTSGSLLHESLLVKSLDLLCSSSWFLEDILRFKKKYKFRGTIYFL